MIGPSQLLFTQTQNILNYSKHFKTNEKVNCWFKHKQPSVKNIKKNSQPFDSNRTEKSVLNDKKFIFKKKIKLFSKQTKTLPKPIINDVIASCIKHYLLTNL